MPALAASPHLRFDEGGTAWIDDTNTTVLQVAMDHLAYGWSAETIHEQFAELSLAQIYAALAYFYDHQSLFAEKMLMDQRSVAALKKDLGDSPLQRRLRQLKLEQ